MKVRDLILSQKYHTPIKIVGGNSKDEFFTYTYSTNKYQRESAMWLHGNRDVRHYYFSTDYGKWWNIFDGIKTIGRLFHWVNPQILVIEVFDGWSEIIN